MTVEQVEVKGKPAVRIALQAEDRNGCAVTFSGSAKLGFEVLSKSGEVLMSGGFSYG